MAPCRVARTSILVLAEATQSHRLQNKDKSIYPCHPPMKLKVRAFTTAIELFIVVSALWIGITLPIRPSGPYAWLQWVTYCLAMAAVAACVPLCTRLRMKGAEWYLTREALLLRSTSTGRTVETIAFSDVTRCICRRFVPFVGRTWEVRLRTNQIPSDPPVLFSIFGLKITHSPGQRRTCVVRCLSNEDKDALAAACNLLVSVA
ncbi:MAG: hypothetical protein JWM57_956 [Phycisphaerales bacterium]|nr:hypothetical protein [Phycisphaerales bacterium]